MTSKRLDKTRPYGEVHGGVNVLFLQDDILFDKKGRETTLEAANLPDKDDDVIAVPDAAVVDYRNMGIVALKVLVESYGETYQNKASAISFLEGHTSHASIDE